MLGGEKGCRREGCLNVVNDFVRCWWFRSNLYEPEKGIEGESLVEENSYLSVGWKYLLWGCT